VTDGQTHRSADGHRAIPYSTLAWHQMVKMCQFSVISYPETINLYEHVNVHSYDIIMKSFRHFLHLVSNRSLNQFHEVRWHHRAGVAGCCQHAVRWYNTISAVDERLVCLQNSKMANVSDLYKY